MKKIASWIMTLAPTAVVTLLLRSQGCKWSISILAGIGFGVIFWIGVGYATYLIKVKK